uniref:MoxR family ATPase n=1 Tax=Gracilinema caldarium TaxID=215591 RepID=A0A7C3IPF2_9SPIR
MNIEQTQATAVMHEIEEAVLSAFVGDRSVVQLALIGLFGSLHVLIEDIPGLGKTTLALALARSAGLSFSRIQCTPDLLPADVLGLSVWDSNQRQFVFKGGPILANFVLADELNRASPRTQSAFLEALQEGAISVDGTTMPLPEPFFMVATQNPQNFIGTFPLPEAELDRFGLCFSIGYPSIEHEKTILERNEVSTPVLSVPRVANPEMVATIRNLVRTVHISEPIRQYIMEIVRSTRTAGDIKLGASPRSGIYLQQAAKARALYEGRNFVLPEDVEALAKPVLAHRLVLASQSRMAGKQAGALVAELVSRIRKPTGL